jgi:short-subunit dehydrogenase
MCKAVLPIMIQQNFGRIYNVGSWAHMGPIEDSAAYSTTKGGVHVLTKAIAKDIARLGRNIQVHEWIPGHMKTQMSGFTGIDPALAAGWGLAIATRQQASGISCIFENDHEWQPPKSLARRLKDKLRFRR